MSQPKEHWFYHFDNVKRLGRYLATMKDYSGKELQAYYERPWKWDDSWDEMLEAEKEPMPF